MRDDRGHSAGIVLDPKAKEVVLIQPGLLDVSGLVVLLGPEGGVTQVGQKKARLLVDLGLLLFREVGLLTDEALRKGRLHLAASRRARTAALAVRKGPMNRLFS